MSEAIGLFLTFTTYGAHLHGADRGSVDRDHRAYASPMLRSSPQMANRAIGLMPEPPFYLDEDRSPYGTAIDSNEREAPHLASLLRSRQNESCAYRVTSGSSGGSSDDLFESEGDGGSQGLASGTPAILGQTWEHASSLERGQCQTGSAPVGKPEFSFGCR